MADLQTMLSYFLQDLLSGFVGTTLSTGLLAKDGSVNAPSMAFASEPTTGIYRSGAGVLDFSNQGTRVGAFSGTAGGFFLLRDTAAINMGLSSDTVVSRNAAAGVLKLANGTAANTAEFQVSGGNGGFLSSVKVLTELTTIAAAATTSTAIQIPANAVVLAVSVRVVTVIPTAATFTVTSATPAKTWNTVAVPVAANTTDPGTAPGPSFQTTASAIVITPNLTPAAATGQVRVTIYYYAVTPATS